MHFSDNLDNRISKLKQSRETAKRRPPQLPGQPVSRLMLHPRVGLGRGNSVLNHRVCYDLFSLIWVGILRLKGFVGKAFTDRSFLVYFSSFFFFFDFLLVT